MHDFRIRGSRRVLGFKKLPRPYAHDVFGYGVKQKNAPVLIGKRVKFQTKENGTDEAVYAIGQLRTVDLNVREFRYLLEFG